VRQPAPSRRIRRFRRRSLRRWVVGAERFKVESGGETTGAVATHPAVQAAIAEFQGEVVAVRPRLPEGEGQ